jgi:predicted AlkP superfamily phosphohydrolase/phosphomutase
MVAGYGCPGPQSSFTYPGEFRRELLAQIPDYEIKANWDWSPKHDFDVFNQNVERVERSFDQRFEAARLVSKSVHWDIMMIQFHDIDVMEHCIWSYLERRTRDNYIAHRDRLFKMFEKLDIVIGRLLDLSSSRELLVVVVSDHGLTRRIVDVRPNMLLHQWGYLKLKRASQRFMRRMRQNLLRHLPGKKGKDGKQDIGHDEYGDCDRSLSKAIMLFTAVSGYVFLNVKGRQPNGCVHPGEEYDSIVRDLRMRFSELKCPVSDQPIFRRVGTPAEIYEAAHIDVERFGDLILVPQAGYMLKSSCSISRKYAQVVPEHSAKGCHCLEGMYVFSGHNIKAAAAEEAQIADIAPTVYAALGAKLPSYMDGKVLTTIFREEPKILVGKSDVPEGPKKDTKVYTAEEEKQIEKYLVDLGYID